MDYHQHLHNEDFVLFIYLKDCKDGNTVFHLNNFDSEFAYRTKFEIQPREGRSKHIFFLPDAQGRTYK